VSCAKGGAAEVETPAAGGIDDEGGPFQRLGVHCPLVDAAELGERSAGADLPHDHITAAAVIDGAAVSVRHVVDAIANQGAGCADPVARSAIGGHSDRLRARVAGNREV
jgi:hypothetical protein